MNTGKSQLKVYHYIDEEGLDRLYAQCGDFLVERLTKVEVAGKLDANAQIGIGELLKLVGLVRDTTPARAYDQIAHG